MEIPLLAPVRGQRLSCLAVDKADARVRDDGFRISQRGTMTQIDMVAIIPPNEVLSRENLIASLKILPDPKMKDHVRELMRPLARPEFSLSHIPQNVLVITHLLRGEVFVREEINLATAVATTTSYEEYTKSERFFKDRIAVMRAVEAQPFIKKHLKETCVRELAEEIGEGGLLVYALLELFNRTCRTRAYQTGTAYVTLIEPRNALPVYRICSGFGRWNRGLREPCAHFNIMSIVRRLKNLGEFIPVEELKRHLPYQT